LDMKLGSSLASNVKQLLKSASPCKSARVDGLVIQGVCYFYCDLERISQTMQVHGFTSNFKF
jgi:hypothetical protein